MLKGGVFARLAALLPLDGGDSESTPDGHAILEGNTPSTFAGPRLHGRGGRSALHSCWCAALQLGATVLETLRSDGACPE